MKTIEIDGKEYDVDLDKAINDGYLKPKKEPVKAEVGGVYKHPDSRFNPLVCVQVVYIDIMEIDPNETRIFQLLGLAEGTRPNSNKFYGELHTLKEIEDYLNELGMEHVLTRGRYDHIQLNS